MNDGHKKNSVVGYLFFLPTLLFSCSGGKQGIGQSTHYIYQIEGQDNDNAFRIAKDSTGNIVILGSFSGDVDFGGGVRTSDSAFVVKLDPMGNYLWDYTCLGEVGVFGTLLEKIGDVVVDSKDNIFVTGLFHGLVDFGGGVREGNGPENCFVLKLDKKGNYLEDFIISPISSKGAVQCASIDLDSDGNLYLMGKFNTSIDFGGEVKSSPQYLWAIFIAKFDTNFSYIWSFVEPGSFVRSYPRIVVSKNQEVYFSGWLKIDKQDDSFIYDTVYTKLNSFGQLEREFKVSSFVTTGGIALEDNKSIFVAVNSTENSTIFKFDSAGTEIWRHPFEVQPNVLFSELTITRLKANAAGNVSISGFMHGSINFGCEQIRRTAAEGEWYNAFVVTLDGEGNCLGTKIIGTPDSEVIAYDLLFENEDI